MLKYMPEEKRNRKKTLEKCNFFSKEQVSLFENLNRRSHNGENATQKTDSNLSDKITKFATSIAG